MMGSACPSARLTGATAIKNGSDGCEAPIKHRLYCDGDPRFVEELAPTITFLPVGDSTGSGSIPSLALSAAFERSRPLLQRCYDQVLGTTPDAGGVVTYRITIDAKGCIEANQIKSDVGSAKLNRCLERFFAQVRLSQAPTGGTVVWDWKGFLGAPEAGVGP